MKLPGVKIIDRYIITQVMSFFLGVVALLTILLIMETMFELMEMLINKKVPFFNVLELLIYRLPAFLVLTFPIALLGSSELAISQMSTNNEIAAMRTGGISFRRIMQPFLIAGIIISILSFLTNDYIVPEANHISQNIIREIVLKKGPPQIQRNVFFRDAENRYFYINRLDEDTMIMREIMVYEMTRERFPRVITAVEGQWVEDTWELKNGTIYNYNENGKITYEMSFQEMEINVKDELQNFFKNQRTPQEMTSRELKQQIQILSDAGVDTKNFEVDYHVKFSYPLSGLIFALLGVPLGTQMKRSTKATGIIISIGLVFVYYVVYSLSRSLGRGGMIDPFIASWLPNVLFLILGIFLVYQAEKT
ncbi:MAG: LptF/LptG family permease [Candidatus Caldatribacteriota bacterium]|nr:LptF/LptG family permease [Atribacterota bacterium]MDD4289070.1 LptF/LptG family permease [Atribacterota bacterium]MDI9596905.1 LptF/LptG family permease [Atribacterota bacterium]